MSSFVSTIDSRSKQKALSIARFASEKKAADIVVLEVGNLTSIADYFVFASGESERQVKAIAQCIEEGISSEFGVVPQIEGAETSTWILLDYGDIVVHIFKTETREYYGLEKMWADAPQITLPTEAHPPVTAQGKPRAPRVAFSP